MHRTLTALTVLLLAAGVTEPVLAQRYTLAGPDVAVYNLVGTLTVTGGAGGVIEVHVTPRGRDASQVRIETGRVGGRDALRVGAPGARLVYPEMGRGSRTQLQVANDGTFGSGGRGRSVTIAGSGSGAQAYADVAVTVPPGRTVRLYVAVGAVDVSNVDGDVHVHTSAARSRVRDVSGELTLRSSSGSAEIANVTGGLTARTSSGSVRAANVRGGSHSVHTSSGGIDLTGVVGDALELRASSGSITARDVSARINAQTSSGSVALHDASGDRIAARASSGRLRAERVAAAELQLHTSSGSIEFAALTPPRSVDISASSGSVRGALPADFSGSVDIRTGSGGINSELPVEVTQTRRNELVGRIGTGSSTLRIRTASGSVRLTRA
jgi:lia operon protein LiaG